MLHVSLPVLSYMNPMSLGRVRCYCSVRLQPPGVFGRLARQLADQPCLYDRRRFEKAYSRYLGLFGRLNTHNSLDVSISYSAGQGCGIECSSIRTTDYE